MEQHDTPEKTYDLERLIFFSDGVFAIVITLLVIDLRPPAGWDRTFAGLWNTEWRSLLAYVVSFGAVGAYWNSHRRLFARVTRFHPGLVLLNLLLLGCVVLLPFAAKLIFETGPRGEPFVIYLALISAIGAAQALLWGFAAFIAKVVDARMPARDRLVVFATMLLGPALICAAAFEAAQDASSQRWIWIVPLLAVAAIARRRLLSPPPKRPAA
jgi:uncharacterized membrane protein